MTFRLVGAIALGAAAAAFAVIGDATAQRGSNQLHLTAHDRSFTWDDQEGEANYHVSGNVDYWPPPSCRPDRFQLPAEHRTFDQLMPMDATSFTLPPPNDERLTFKKEVAFNIEALDANDSIIVRDGFAFTADPVCTEVDLAAAGSGPATPDGPNIAVLAALLTAGVGGLAAGAIIRRKARSDQ